MTHTPIPVAEIGLLKQLGDLRVIIDVGARTDVDYLDIFPGAEFHLFEPNPEFFRELEENVGERTNVFLNNYGLGDKECVLMYRDAIQSFVGSEAPGAEDGAYPLPVKILDWYTDEARIDGVDFLKIDTEGFDFRVLLGGRNTLKITKFLQYEHWDDKEQFHRLLKKDFELRYVGYRNVLCMNKKLVSAKEKTRIRKYIKENKLSELR